MEIHGSLVALWAVLRFILNWNPGSVLSCSNVVAGPISLWGLMLNWCDILLYKNDINKNPIKQQVR